METNDRDRFDDVLDKALRHYGNVEPRIGLESRILANMQVAGKRALSGYRWVLAGAIATALVIAIDGGIWHQALMPKQNITLPPVPKNALRAVGSETIPRTPQIAKTRAPRQRRYTSAASSVASTSTPKLDRFPSPLPLSQQELLFASYAEHFPKEALLLVQEQRDFEEDIRLAERDARPIPQVYIEKGK
jgi:hypothetical protein